jgi:diacylglycerol O-acyltransferase / wax synthase
VRRLTAADSWFLYLETPTVHLHVTGVVLLDPSTAPDGLTFGRLQEHISERLHMIPMFRRRLIEVPLGIDHPVWIEDPDFRLGDHVHHHVLGATDAGAEADREFADFVGTFCSQQLDRARPLWDMVYVEGLAGGRTALVTKLHHALVDGITGVDIMAHLLDTSPEPGPLTPEDPPWIADEVPSPTRAAVDASANRIRTPLRPVRAVWRTLSSTARMTAATMRSRLGPGERAAGAFNAPRTPFNSTLTARRSVAFGATSLSDVKATRRAFGVTVNDVVLAACTFGLRRQLERNGTVPDRPLTCSVPVSVHGKVSGSTNQVSSMFVYLPVDEPDPVEQLHRVHTSAGSAKAVQDAMAPEMIGDVVDLIPPPLFHLGADLWSRVGLPDRLPPVHNLIISNVPGSPVPLYIAGAQLVALYPFGPLMEGTALNVTVLSNLDDLDVGLISCPDLVPDLDLLLGDIIQGFDTLHRLGRDATGAVAGADPDAAVDLTTRKPARTRQRKGRA